MKKQLIILAIICIALLLSGCLSTPKNKGDIENFYGRFVGESSVGSLLISIEFESNGHYNSSRLGLHYSGTWGIDGDKIYLNETSPFISYTVFTYKWGNNCNLLILKNQNYKETWTLTRQG